MADSRHATLASGHVIEMAKTLGFEVGGEDAAGVRLISGFGRWFVLSRDGRMKDNDTESVAIADLPVSTWTAFASIEALKEAADKLCRAEIQTENKHDYPERIALNNRRYGCRKTSRT